LVDFIFGRKDLMRSVEQHLEVVLANASPLESLEVGLLGAVGCVLAEKVTTEDDEKEHVLLPQGTAIGARHVALLAAANLGQIWVHPKPRVVILTVGSDLADPGMLENLRPDINGIALTTASTAAGAMTFRVGPLQSDSDLIRSAIEDQLVRADVIITACGMNAGDYDLLTSVLRELGRVEISRVNMTPGGAQGFGVIGPDSTPIFVLPGNPVGALLSFDIFVRPLIRRLMGHSKLHHRIIEARLETTVEGAGDDARYVRARVSRTGDFPLVKSVENNDDHPLAGLGTAEALIVVPPGTVRMNAGDTVKVMQLVDLSDE
jgi:molybdopterin molybdotransferase